MEKTITLAGRTVKLATITVDALEKCDLAGKNGRTFNIALVVASALAGGFSETGLEAWVRSLQAFAPEAEESQFQQVVNAANVVNYFETEEDQVAARKAKADALAAVKAGRRPKGESEPAAPAGA
jgi:hypothetical protein